MTDSAEEKKIVVDEDWKSQVESDRDELRHSESLETPEEGEQSGAIPPPSFESLIVSIATQAMGCLGQMQDKDGNPMIDLEVAKHLIDTLSVLEEKTKGNLTTEEGSMLENMMHQLHLFYVSVSSAMTGSSPPASETPESPDSGIILP